MSGCWRGVEGRENWIQNQSQNCRGVARQRVTSSCVAKTTRRKSACYVGAQNNQKQSRGVRPRTPVPFFVRPKKGTKETPPRFAAAARYPALLDRSGGCGTRAMRSDITSDLAGVVCQLSRMASCFISPRRNPLTSLRYSAAHRGYKVKT